MISCAQLTMSVDSSQLMPKNGDSLTLFIICNFMPDAISSILRLTVLLERDMELIFCSDSSPNIIFAALRIHGLIKSSPMV